MHRNKIDMLRTKRLTRRAFALYAALVLVCCAATPVLADGDPLTVVSNLSTFIFSIIRAIGLILLGWGIVQVGLSLQSHDPSHHYHLCQRDPGPDRRHRSLMRRKISGKEVMHRG